MAENGVSSESFLASNSEYNDDNLDSSTGIFDIGTWNPETDSVVDQQNNTNVDVFNSDNEITSEYFMDNAVILQLPKFSKGFKASDFSKFVRRYVGEENVENLEQRNYPNTWLLLLKSKEIRENLLRMWKTKIKNKTCWINPYHDYEIRGFLHWLPHFISDDDVKTQLSQFGKVLFLKNEVHDYWNGKIKSEVKYFGLLLKAGNKKDDLPHFLKFSDYRTLLIVRGRKTACFHCRVFGHSKNDCKKYKEKLDEYCKNPEAKTPRKKPRGRRHRPESDVKNDGEDNKPLNESNSNSSKTTTSQKELNLVKSNQKRDYSYRKATDNKKKEEILTTLRSLMEWKKEITGMSQQILNMEENFSKNLIPIEYTESGTKEFSQYLVEVNKSFDDMKHFSTEIIDQTLINLKNIVAEHFGLDSHETLEKLISNLKTKRETLGPKEVKFMGELLLSYNKQK